MELDRLVYREERTINIGNYESMKCSFSYSGPVRDINNLEKTITIAEQDVQTINGSNKEFQDTIKLMQKRVKAVLNEREANIRIATEAYTDDSHSSIEKAFMTGAVSEEKLIEKLEKVNAKRKKMKQLQADIALDDSVFDDE